MAGPGPTAGNEDLAQVQLHTEINLRIQATVNRVLQSHLQERPANTDKNYIPKQREWKKWCERMAFPLGGQCLPYDWVDEGKLLLFVMEEVVYRAPRAGPRLAAARKRKAAATASACTYTAGSDADAPPRKRKHRLTAGRKKDEKKRVARGEREGEKEQEGAEEEDAANRQLLIEQTETPHRS